MSHIFEKNFNKLNITCLPILATRLLQSWEGLSVLVLTAKMTTTKDVKTSLNANTNNPPKTTNMEQYSRFKQFTLKRKNIVNVLQNSITIRFNLHTTYITYVKIRYLILQSISLMIESTSDNSIGNHLNDIHKHGFSFKNFQFHFDSKLQYYYIICEIELEPFSFSL